jgi:hypothetical protein
VILIQKMDTQLSQTTGLTKSIFQRRSVFT